MAGTTPGSTRWHDDLKASLVRGQLLYPDDPAYADSLRTWNLQALRRPSAVVQAHGPGDVVATVKYAKAKGLQVTVKSGGHSMSCLSNGITLDMSSMKSIRVDVERKTARVEPGCLLGDLDAETSVHGLVVPAGVVSHTGVAGLTLGGGWGYLGRSMGLTCDNLLSVDIVTADGQLRKASKTSNEDLFWAVRGAGSSFGVVTSFKFRCHPLPNLVYGAKFEYPFSRYLEVAREWKRVVTSGTDVFPHNMTVYLLGAPRSADGQGLATKIIAVINGPEEESAKLLQPFHDLHPTAVQVGAMPYTLIQQAADPLFPSGRHYYQSGTFVKELKEELFEAVHHYLGACPAPYSLVVSEPQGGKISEVPDDECAIGWRANKYFFALFSAWEKEEESDENKVWARKLVGHLKQFRARTNYINLGGAAVPEEKGHASDFYGSHVERLRQLKEKWDRENVFQSQTNLIHD